MVGTLSKKSHFTKAQRCSFKIDGIGGPKWKLADPGILGKTAIKLKHTNTHTHPFNGPLSGTTRVSRYQKGKTNLDFTEARDNEWQWHQLGPYASLHLAADRQPCQHPTTLFYRPDALSAAQPTASKH